MAWKISIKDHKSGSVSEQTLDQRSVHLGRDPNSDILLEHSRVSRRHLELRQGDDDHLYLLETSRNGTFVRLADKWCRIHGTIGLIPPFTFRIADWSVQAEQIIAEPAVEEVEQTWDESVIIPAGSLAQQTESILVFDLCESSLIASKDDHMAYHLKHRLTQIAEPVLEEYNHRFFKSTGDGFLATFKDADKALQAAIKIEDHIQYRNQRTTNAPIHYRLALHYGDVWAISAGGDDIHGNDVNITFRIEGVQSAAFAEVRTLFPKRDRILCSERFRKQVEDTVEQLSSGCVSCGAATLKGIVDPVIIYWLKTQYSEEDLDATMATQSIPAPR
jgi:class 3 adenylate cyclase